MSKAPTTLRTSSESQFVSLGIGAEVFAVPVDTVLEILDMQPVFRVPETPTHVLGLIDLRGRSVPVLDLRTKLGLPAIPATETTRILVLEVAVAGRRLVLGLVADRVIEVMALDAADIEPPPDVGVGWRSAYIAGVGHRDGKFVVIFDLAQLFSTEDTNALGVVSPSPEVRAVA
ncbi:chemotaxis protein CheW [Siculibacillus lacustris]|uniref:Chemotaxis protein CheW n=1 Tax=Siculibacillus lacustris TaxID=1549641 RepID=A0A4Q9VPF8_9HYPH|nr:chemotaxis protein CheW [Siculibacillus lacustris]TBW37611.1 chemotaxis protein CheW [Siculibacillus lacustris]